MYIKVFLIKNKKQQNIRSLINNLYEIENSNNNKVTGKQQCHNFIYRTMYISYPLKSFYDSDVEYNY